MPTLDFKGKQFIYAHHLGVPYRTLEADAKKSVKGGEAADGNMIIQGDNLDALKALLPTHAGRVNCIYIDPPYNTGNEGWCYNDKVNSPLMKRWLADNGKVDGEDLERHEKWLCMMWPRLQLLRELLAEDGVIFVSIDDNEAHRLRLLMDEIFGEENFVANIVAQTNPRGRSLSQKLAQTHEYVLAYAKDALKAKINAIKKPEETLAEYKEQDEFGFYRLLRLRNSGIQFFNRKTRPNLFYPIYVNPQNGEVSVHPTDSHTVKALPVTASNEEGCWTWGREKLQENARMVCGKRVRGGAWRIYRKDYLPHAGATTKERALWSNSGVNHEIGKETLAEIFDKPKFDHPKSPLLIARALNLVCDKDAVVLDSFAGSGTTAHAVLALNKEDGGNRKFILVECEDYADTITAERVRRVIKGVKTAKDETLKKGLGGGFSFRTLGRAIGLEEMLSGGLPDGDTLAHYVAHTALGATLDKIKRGKDGFFGEVKGVRLHLIYKPDSAFLESSASALSGALAESIQKAAAGKKVMVFAPWKFMSQAELTPMGITFCQLPYALYRLFGDSADVS